MNKHIILILFLIFPALWVLNNLNLNSIAEGENIERLKTQMLSTSENKQKMPLTLSNNNATEEVDLSDNETQFLWKVTDTEIDQDNPLPAEVAVASIQADMEQFQNLLPGQKVALYIPQEQGHYLGTVKENYQQFQNQVSISSGSIDSDSPFASFTVNKGPELTVIMVSTAKSVYQVEINNSTGHGTVVDDKALDHFRQSDDTILPPPEGIS